MIVDLKNKVALVTGGSKGIGKGAAKALAKAGAKVFICARDLDEMENAIGGIKHENCSNVKAIQADITHQEDVDSLIQTINEQAGPIDILVNNVGGIGSNKPFEQLAAEEFTALYDLNVVTMVRMVQAVLPGMKQLGGGRIINISSENGLQPDPQMMAYNLTKAAIINFSKGLSKLYGKDNILVNTVSPAFIYTPLVKNMLQSLAKEAGSTEKEASDQFLKNNRPGIDLGRSGTIDEVGAAVVFLASPQASFINGTNLRVDGGSVSCI